MKRMTRSILSLVLALLVGLLPLLCCGCGNTPESPADTTGSPDPAGPDTDGTDTTLPDETTASAPTLPDESRSLEDQFSEMEEIVPTVTYLEGYEDVIGDARIQPVFYSGIPYRGHETEIFAYYAIPEGASKENPVPGVILMHPYGGHPDIFWVQYWLDSGYAVLGMCHQYARMPSKDNPGEWVEYESERFHVEHGGDSFEGAGATEYGEQWCYYAVSDAILANNVLRADERVDADKIGITAFSLGTTPLNIAMTYDHRLAFAVPICGAGYLTENTGRSSRRFVDDSEFADVWEPSYRYDQVTCPVLFIGSAREFYYSCDTESKSAEHCPGAYFSLQYLLSHVSTSGQICPEAVRFADCVLAGRDDPLCKVTDETYDETSRTFTFSFTVPEDLTVSEVKFCYTDTPFGTYKEMLQNPPMWKCTSLEKNDDNTYSVEVPENVAIFYGEITANCGAEDIQRRYLISSTYVHVLKTEREAE